MATNNTNGTKQKLVPPLPLIPEAIPDDDETQLAKFKLRAEPTQVDSPTYSFTMLKSNGSGSLRQAIQFLINLLKVYHGLNLVNPGPRLNIAQELMTGQALVQFNKGYDKALTCGPTRRPS